MMQTIKKLIPRPVKSVVRSVWQYRSHHMRVEPYRPGAYPRGINLLGYIYAEMGLGQGCRCIADGLLASEIPFSIVDYEIGPKARKGDLSFQKWVGEPLYDINLTEINADMFPQARLHMGRSYWNKRYQISHFSWELPTFPKKWNTECGWFDEIWTPSRFCTKAISQQTSTPVYTMPFSIRPQIHQPRKRNYFGLPDDAFLFLCMFDVNSVMERKNPMGAIRAFCKAFSSVAGAESGNKPVGLVVKINNFTRQLDGYSELHRLIDTHPNIYVIDRIFSRNDLNALICSCDSFVSLHRSEGFGLVLAEAMYLGRPVIATNWSANTDFMTSENACPVEYRLETLQNSYAVYQKGQVWAKADEDHCAEYMRKLVCDGAYYRRIAENGRKTIQKNYSPEASARFIRARIQTI